MSVLPQEQHGVRRKERRDADHPRPFAADLQTQPLDVVEVENRTARKQHAHRDVLGQRDAIAGNRQRQSQRVLHFEHARGDECGQLPKAVAEHQPRAAILEVEELFQNLELCQRGRHDQSDRFVIGFEIRFQVCLHPGDQVDRLAHGVRGDFAGLDEIALER